MEIMSLKDFTVIFHSLVISKPFCGQCRDCWTTLLVSELSVTLFFMTRNEMSPRFCKFGLWVLSQSTQPPP